jgi:chemotaxis protein CheX
MPSELSVQLQAGDLSRIVESVFGTMLDLTIDKCVVPGLPSGDLLTAVVHLAGAWNGVVLLECDRQQACRFAGRFLSMEPPETVDTVVRDVLGELVQMIGGNLKSVLTPGLDLSLPSVVDGSDYCLGFRGVEVLERLAVGSAEGLFWVTVLGTPS